MKILIAVLTLTAASILGVIGFAYSGIYDVAATSPHSGFSSWLLSTTSQASIARRAADSDVPDLDDPALIKAGINDFDAMCSGCHGAPGKQPAAIALGLNPPPPDLGESAGHLSAAELFWVTKNGIRMSGMPAWGASHEDDALWPVVAFMMVLPALDASEYQALLKSAEGVGHHAPADQDEEHAEDHDELSPATDEAAHHDDHEHSH